MNDLAALGICLGFGAIISATLFMCMAFIGAIEKPGGFKEWLATTLEDILFKK